MLAVVALALYERARPAPGSTLHKWARAALFVAAGLVGLAGHFGGTLVHGLSFYTF
ncbi:hypothetical protein HS125_15755 [bacterium]|nr:hypothetical protein [bacterium]